MPETAHMTNRKSASEAWAVYLQHPVPYSRAVRWQEALVAARLAQTIPDTILMLEHLPVITLGARASSSHLLLSPEELKYKGIALESSSRGGDVTWHGPGQLVLYPILQLSKSEADLHAYLRNLEEVALLTARDFGITAFRRPGLTGIWTQQGKLAAIGVHFKQWVTSHGLSFNVCPDLKNFDYIIPCGLKNEKVTSVQQILGANCPSLQIVQQKMLEHFCRIYQRQATVFQESSTPPILRSIMVPFAPN